MRIRITSILFAVLAICLAGCHDDNDDPKDPGNAFTPIKESEFQKNVEGSFWKLDRGVWYDKEGNRLETIDADRSVRMVYGFYYWNDGVMLLTKNIYRYNNAQSEIVDYRYDPKTGIVGDGTEKWNMLGILKIDSADEITVSNNYGVWREEGCSEGLEGSRYVGIYKRMPLSAIKEFVPDWFKPTNYNPEEIDFLQ